jgi:UDP-glucose 4-epimerase
LLEKLQAKFREIYLDESVMEAPYAKWIFYSLSKIFQLGRVPYAQDLVLWISPKHNNLSCLPINRDIEGAEGINLTNQVLDHFLEKAKHRVIVDVCACRRVLGCKEYPMDIGCMMMGESALNIPKKISRQVGIVEAKAHVHRAIEAGLIPTTGKVRIDKDFFMVPGDGKLLTLCFCCECCSVTRFFRYASQQKLDGMHPPVEGLSIEVTNECDGCNECVSRCHLNAIEVKGERAVIGGMCRVCGRCALHCPRGAMKLKLTNPAAVEDVVRRIEAVVEY